ncbi:MAG TPA: hypothetical protein VGU71_22320 [Candidatus Dormibacteraeota bacterium]|nr:hypothetical protein [Candidatus Dormibacteraeota bacterium]
MPGPTRAGVRKQLAAMVSAYQPGAQERVAEAGLAANYSGQGMSPLMLRSSMGWGMDPALGAPLPRDPRVFLSQMDPNMPQPPMALDPRGPGGRPLPRLNQYPLNWNLPSAPGTYKMVPFKLMRNIVDMSHVARDCIGVRQNEIADVEFEVAPKEEERGQFKVMPDKKAGLFDQYRTQRKALQAFWEHPDPIRGLDYDEWIRMAIEEMLVTDSLAVFEHPTWGAGGGVLGSDLYALTILDGTCYSADTEVLTKRGWLRFDQVDIANDEFATRNQVSHAFEWETATYFHQADYSGEMIHLTSRTLDLLVSPNHRVLVDRLPRSHGGWDRRSVRGESIVTAKALADDYEHGGICGIPVTSTWAGTPIPAITIPSNGRTNSKAFSCTGDQFAAFMGMWLSEGSVGSGTNDDQVFVTQQPESKGFEPFRQLLIEIFGFEPVHTGHSWVIGRRVLADFLRPFGHAHEKYVPEIIRDAPREQLAIFWHYYMLGDGHFATDGREGIITASRLMADHMQEIAQKLGFSAAVLERAPSKVAVTIGGRQIVTDRTHYTVRLRTSPVQRFRVERERYEGQIYCVSVPNEILYVRRNGQPAWCGNTIKPMLDIRGGPPQPPNPAYQQFVWGLPRVDLISLVMDARDDTVIQDAQRGFSYSQAEFLELTRDQLAYMPYHKRAWTAYGYSNVEQVIMVINVALKRLGWHLARFTDGDIPAMLVHTPETWTLDQVNKYEAQWHAMLAGDQGWKWRMKAIPGAIAAQELKPPVHDMTFDDYIDRAICAGFAVDPTEIGIEPKGGLGGTGYMESQDDRRKRLTVGPVLRRFKRYFDGVHARRFGIPELEIRYDGLDIEDEATEHKIDIERVTRGTMTINGYLKKRGEPTSDEPNADKLMLILSREVMRVEDIGGPLDPNLQQPGGDTGVVSGGKKPDAAPDATAVKKSIDDELDSFASFLKRPRARRFSSEILPKAAIDAVYRRLAAGDERKTVLSDLRKSVLEGSEMLASEVADAILEHHQAEKAGSLR